jgi:hypothetical protein
MNKREFITLLGGAVTAWPLTARAQQSAAKLPRIGSIQNFRNENFEAFIEGLREAGYMDGQNMLLETRFYAGAVERVDEFARELVGLKCSVILATAPICDPGGDECDEHHPDRRHRSGKRSSGEQMGQESRTPGRQFYRLFPRHS